MPSMNQTRRPTDTLMLASWVFGYQALIGCFSILQGVERFLAGSDKMELKTLPASDLQEDSGEVGAIYGSSDAP
jgi:hypothetical protein